MEQPEVIISSNLKRVREEKNLSYTQLSELTGVSKSMLRQIEIGDSSPTINTLWKIANGLQVPFSTLINPPRRQFSKISFTDSDPLHGMSEGYRLYPMLSFENKRHFEMYYVEMDGGIELDADPHSGNVEELLIVLEGLIVVESQGSMMRVKAHEMLVFDAGYPHHYHNPLDEMAKALTIISYVT